MKLRGKKDVMNICAPMILTNQTAFSKTNAFGKNIYIILTHNCTKTHPFGGRPNFCTFKRLKYDSRFICRP